MSTINSNQSNATIVTPDQTVPNANELSSVNSASETPSNTVALSSRALQQEALAKNLFSGTTYQASAEALATTASSEQTGDPLIPNAAGVIFVVGKSREANQMIVTKGPNDDYVVNINGVNHPLTAAALENAWSIQFVGGEKDDVIDTSELEFAHTVKISGNGADNYWTGGKGKTEISGGWGKDVLRGYGSQTRFAQSDWWAGNDVILDEERPDGAAYLGYDQNIHTFDSTKRSWSLDKWQHGKIDGSQIQDIHHSLLDTENLLQNISDLSQQIKNEAQLDNENPETQTKLWEQLNQSFDELKQKVGDTQTKAQDFVPNAFGSTARDAQKSISQAWKVAAQQGQAALTEAQNILDSIGVPPPTSQDSISDVTEPTDGVTQTADNAVVSDLITLDPIETAVAQGDLFTKPEGPQVPVRPTPTSDQRFEIDPIELGGANQTFLTEPIHLDPIEFEIPINDLFTKPSDVESDVASNDENESDVRPLLNRDNSEPMDFDLTIPQTLMALDEEIKLLLRKNRI